MIRRWREAYARRRHGRRCAAQWMDACLLMGNALRAGMNLSQAIRMAAEEGPPPLGDELKRVIAECAVGGRIDTALRELARRLATEEITLVAQAIHVLHATGGNLVAVFDRVVDLVREERRVMARVRTMTAQGRMTGWIVAALPFVMLMILHAVMPGMVRPLFVTGLGRLLLFGALALQVLGLCWMRAVIRIRV
ncbi:MAG: type II secretion system F family protein [Deltaproteobacteria bacterium]|nr:type II secretion system F family protein [Deltaproteobacteria bacterium]